MSAVVPQPSVADLRVEPSPFTTVATFRRAIAPDRLVEVGPVTEVAPAAPTPQTVQLLTEAKVPLPERPRDGNTRSTPENERADFQRICLRVALSAVAIAVVIVLWQLFYQLWGDSAAIQDAYERPVQQPLQGLTIFAVFFVAALALEQLLSPLTRALVPTSRKVADLVALYSEWQSQHALATAAARHLNQVVDSIGQQHDPNSPLPPKVAEATANVNETAQQSNVTGDEVAVAFDQLSLLTVSRLLLLWTMTTSVAMLSVVFTHLHFLRQVGIDSGLAVDTLATGLILGAGTAPLSALVARISAPTKTA